MNKTVVIVEDDEGLRNQLVKILLTPSDIKCLYTAQSGEEALSRILEDPPDVVLMDIKLPGMSGIDCLPRLKKEIPWLEVVMWTVNDETDIIFRALKAGANGYLLKSSRPEVIFGAIRDVHLGGSSFSSDVARKIAQFFRTPPTPNREVDVLSKREGEVLELLASGFVYREIADKMSISMETVRTHVKRICTKMHVRGRVEAIIKYHS